VNTISAAAAVCAALIASNAAAAEEAMKVWLNPGLYSYHLNRSIDYREDNVGLGAEFVISPDHGFIAGNFINSNRTRSQYGGYQWRALHFRPAGVDITLGPVFALINGYSSINNGSWFPAIFPALSIEYGLYGANLSFVPNPRNGSAVALQLKLLVW
jgi:hypothetical protein